MTREKALKLVQDILREEYEIKPTEYVLSEHYESLGLDSLDLVEFGMEVEERLNLSYGFSNQQLDSIKTIEDIVKLVETV